VNPIVDNIIRSLVLYSLAEYQSGHATMIRVNASGLAFEVGDNGRGHAVDRKVNGLPYLAFVYEHLRYPFDSHESTPIQLHTIGLSFINSLCEELSVVIRKGEESTRRIYRHGQFVEEQTFIADANETGNLIKTQVSNEVNSSSADATSLRGWLIEIAVVSPGLRIVFNDVELHVPRPTA
jgi:DNA gyrase/topoisomerase IV subunit B